MQSNEDLAAERSRRMAQLVVSARGVTKIGRLDEAARAWEQVLALAPDNAEALFFFGQHHLAKGDANGAAELFERAMRTNPKDALIPLALAAAHRAKGDSKAELSAYEKALAADPYCYPALLAKGALLERQGQPRAAARMYTDALKITPPEERLSPDLRDLAQRARRAVQENTLAFDAFVETRLGTIRQRHAQAELPAAAGNSVLRRRAVPLAEPA
jgi:tetratricopeptide (TPR) repeat protein